LCSEEDHLGLEEDHPASEEDHPASEEDLLEDQLLEDQKDAAGNKWTKLLV
jgi:hypothetical protein